MLINTGENYATFKGTIPDVEKIFVAGVCGPVVKVYLLAAQKLAR